MSDEKYYMPTVVPAPKFDAETDAQVLYKAMKGFGTDEKTIINIIAFRTSSQIQAIAKKFETMYGKTLEAWLYSELSGKFQDCVIGRLYQPMDYQAYVCRKAMKGMGTNERALIDVICTKSNVEMILLKGAYNALFQRELQRDVKGETSGDFRRFLLSLLSAGRDDKPADEKIAETDARDLYSAGEGKWGTDESKFNMIFASRSFAQLKAMFIAYKKLRGTDIEKAIEKEMSGDLRRAYLTLIRWIKDPIEYYSEVLYKSMKGLGTDDKTLIRTVLARCEIDLGTIKKKFEKLHQKTLDRAVKQETSGYYRTFMLALIMDPTE